MQTPEGSALVTSSRASSVTDSPGSHWPSFRASLLLTLACPHNSDEPFALPGSPSDWRALLDDAAFHGLAPLLSAWLGNRSSGESTDDVAHEAKRLFSESAKRHLALQVRLIELLDRFDAESVPVLPLKGLTLAEGLYQDPALRPSHDLDVFVRPADVPRALSLLQTLGYSLPYHLQRISPGALQRLDSEVRLLEPSGVAVELHWAVSSNDYPFELSLDTLWNDASERPLVGRVVPQLTSECLLLYLCVHGTRHAWARLLWLSDIARLIDRGIDWDRALELAQRTRCLRPLMLGVLLGHELLDAPVPPDVVRRCRGDSTISPAVQTVSTHLFQTPASAPGSVALTAFNGRLAETRWATVRHWAALAIAPRDEDLQRFSLSPHLFWLHRPLRVQRLTFKYARRLFRRAN